MHTQSNRKMDPEIEQLLTIIKRNPVGHNWDLFYVATEYALYCGTYTHRPQIRDLLARLISSLPPPPSSLSNRPEPSASPSPAVTVLVPACGSSRLSEQLYDAGFLDITSVDFSKYLISHMLERNVRKRPFMEWLIMDLREMQFLSETFDAIVDNGGLEALVEPYDGSKSGNLYLSEVKRLLKTSGRYICITLAESEVLGILFSRFRYGWKVNTYAFISGELEKNMLMTVAWKLADSVVSNISVFNHLEESVDSQVHAFRETLRIENNFRTLSSDLFDPFIPLEDLKANLKELEPGRRVKLTLGQPGVSHCLYNCILLDAQQDSGPFSIQLLVLIVPDLCHLKWITTSSKEQWHYVELFKTARLLMVVLDPENGIFPEKDIQEDIYHFVNKLVPGIYNEDQILFKIATDGVKQKETLHRVTSDFSGLIAVDDLIYDKDPRVRSLTVANMERSKALLKRIRPIGTPIGRHDDASGGVLKVDHSHLKSTRHTAMISGLLLISVHLKGSISAHALVKNLFIGRIPLFKMNAVVIGLGAGLLPMFMNQLPYFTTEVVEADPVMLDVAGKYFGFMEDNCLKVHITGGIDQFFNERANCNAEGPGSSKIDILILDVDSPNPKSLLTSPPIEFFEKPFLLTVKNALSEDGFFIINLVTRSVIGKHAIHETLKEIFSNLIYLEIEEGVNEVIFAYNSDSPIEEVHLSEACSALARSFTFVKPKWSQGIIDASKLFKPLKE